MFNGQVETFTALFNGYVDLGTWSKLTPYVGGGIGAAYVVVSNYSNPTAVAPMPSTALAEHRWNLAWAATAGVSYNVTRDFLIDASYRHVEMGDASGGPSRDLTIKRLSGDEIRVGFRYILD
jgi:opacity protein-like surface antigen